MFSAVSVLLLARRNFLQPLSFFSVKFFKRIVPEIVGRIEQGTASHAKKRTMATLGLAPPLTHLSSPPPSTSSKNFLTTLVRSVYCNLSLALSVPMQAPYFTGHYNNAVLFRDIMPSRTSFGGLINTTQCVQRCSWYLQQLRHNTWVSRWH